MQMSRLNFRTVERKQAFVRYSPQQYTPGKPKPKGAAARRDKSRFGWFAKRGKGCLAYYAVCGCSNYYKKVGLRLSDADIHKWQEHTKAAVTRDEGTGQHETKSRKDYFALSVVGVSESHGHNSEIAVIRDVTNAHSAFDSPEGSVQHHSPFHSHHSHHCHGTGHSEWFFMSVWNIAGLNPYAVCIANHKAGKITVEKVKTKVTKSSGINEVHSKKPNNFDKPVSAAVHSSFNKTKFGRDQIHQPAISVFEAFNRIEPVPDRKTKNRPIGAIDNPVRYSVNRNNPLLKGKPRTEVRAKTNAVRSFVTIKDPTPKVKNLNPVINPRLETYDHRPVGYIYSRVPQKIKPKLVVGAEALPE